jgi:lipoate-protein ligase B
MHGFGLNVSTRMQWFDRIVACGIDGVEMTSLESLLREAPTAASVQTAVVTAACDVFQRSAQRKTLSQLEDAVTS